LFERGSQSLIGAFSSPPLDLVGWPRPLISVVVSRAGAAARDGGSVGADVWYRYPREVGPTAPGNQPFHELPNVLMTPHVSGWTDGMLDARAKAIAENIRRVRSGETPLNLVA
jgi:phosphoglycerate dehydrogenase-like enzyme